MFLAVYRFGFLLFWVPCKCTTELYTSLAIKQGIEDYTNSLPMGSSGFLDLVKNSKMFVDTSLFIKEILNETLRSKFILAPRKLGKTTNLLMLKAFLEPQINETGHIIQPREQTTNYKLFMNGEITLDTGTVQKLQSPLLISNYKEICNKYLGLYPVIYITFKDVLADDLIGIKRQINIAVSKAFRAHSYMIPILENSQKPIILKSFTDLLYGEENADYKSSLQFLGQVLKEHYSRNPFLILEDYDVPIYNVLRNGAYRKQEIGDLIDYIHTLLAFAIKTSYVVEQDIITGCFELGYNSIAPRLSPNFRRYSIVEKQEPIQRYFGFSHDIVQQLYRLHNISAPLGELANKWYQAHVFKPTRQIYYHPSSIISFLHYKRIDLYWEDNGNIDVFQTLVEKSLFIRRALLMMLSKNGHIMKSQSYFNKRQINYLQDSFKGRPTYSAGFLALSYLIDLGYLVRNQGMSTSNFTRFTNYETSFMFAKSMIWYYKKTYKFDTELSHNAALSLFNFITSDYVDTSNKMIHDVEDTMTQLYVRSGQMHMLTNTSTHAHAMLNCIMLQVHCMTKLDMDFFYVNALGPDFTVFDRKTNSATIIHFQIYQPSAQQALDEALKFEYIFSYDVLQNATEARFIGINAALNRSVSVMALTKERNQTLSSS